ncbi:MAG: GHKL domain-containing protein [Bacillota bacterium]|nr:GHKL domain-containing protein [Bacillota bacterium]
MTKRRAGIVLLSVLLLLALFCLIGAYAASFPVETEDESSYLYIHQVDCEIDGGASGRLALPARLGGLPKRTAVTLTARINEPPGRYLLVGTVSAPMEVFMNGNPLLSYGQEGSYPAFFNDPPIALILLSLPPSSGDMTLTIRYLTPGQRAALDIPVIRVGTERALVRYQLQQDGFLFIFSLVLICIGLIMTVFALIIICKKHPDLSFLWLGLFAFLAGTWGFGECDLSFLLFPYPALLHVMVFLSILLIPIPFLHFGLLVLDPREPRPMRLALWINYLSLAVALWLQLTGCMDFIRFLTYFQFVLIMNLAVFLFSLLLERLKYDNPAARRFGPGIVILSVFTILEILNYDLRLAGSFTFFFQLGVLGFVFSLGIVGGYYVRDSLRTAQENERLEYQIRAMNLQQALQRQQFQKIAENEAQVEAQRHDLRHHLAVLWELYEQDDRGKLRNYLEALNHRLPAGGRPRLCENYAVNAVATHYAGLAKQAGAEVAVNLSVPADLPPELESDLCIIIGNLMENAVEACARMTGEERFIHVNSRLQYGVLTIAVDNRFEGDLRRQDGVFLSSKREGEGIGLSSVSAVAKKHGGNAEFEVRDTVFRASVYVRLEPGGS